MLCRSFPLLLFVGLVTLALPATERARAQETEGAVDAVDVVDAGVAPEDTEATNGPEDAFEAEDDRPPAEVVVGMYVNAIRSVSLQENAFEVDFWIWFRWPKDGRTVDPLASFEVVQGDIESKSGEVYEDLDEVRYAACRVVARVTTFFDVHSFPNDRHTLRIVIEDSEHEDHELVFRADGENSRLDPNVQVAGFLVGEARTDVTSHEYRTNYGDITLPSDAESTYSRFELQIDIKRPGLGFAVKLLWAFWLSSLIALVALFIKPINLDPRFGLGVGALFAAMANAFVINSALPETTDVTTADAAGMVSIAVIFISIVESIVSLWMFENGREAVAKRLDKISFVVITLAYVVVNVVVLA